MTLELFEQGPGVYIPVLAISLLITVAVYCAFPLLYAKLRKKPITAIKYRVHCFLGNFLIMLLFKLISAGSSASPYFLWTTVFTYYGVKKLRDRGMILDLQKSGYSGKYDQNTVTTAVDISSQSTSEISTPVAITSKSKKSKNRFCKHCGSPIDPDTKKCTGCGKQYFRMPCFNFQPVLIVTVAISIAIVSMCIYRIGQYQTEIEQLQVHISELENELEESERIASDFQDKFRKKFSEAYDLSTRNKKLEASVEKMKNVYDFCTNHVVVVSDDGSRTYHKCNCPYFDDSYFWAYNTELAIQNGYKPCTFCFSQYFSSIY